MSEPSFLIFGYGSLIFDPELAESVLSVRPARLTGHVRTFNKISTSRACCSAESFDAFATSDPRLRRDGLHVSLVLGTAVGHGHIDGAVIEYPETVRDEALTRTDRREGYVADRPSHMNAYLRVSHHVALGGEQLKTYVYVSNSAAAEKYLIDPGVPLADRARVLINATPATPSGPGESRGLYYLERTRRGLRDFGVVDPVLEALAAAVLDLPGPWCGIMHPARRE